jgi:hypothetical protein
MTNKKRNNAGLCSQAVPSWIGFELNGVLNDVPIMLSKYLFIFHSNNNICKIIFDLYQI